MVLFSLAASQGLAPSLTSGCASAGCSLLVQLSSLLSCLHKTSFGLWRFYRKGELRQGSAVSQAGLELPLKCRLTSVSPLPQPPKYPAASLLLMFIAILSFFKSPHTHTRSLMQSPVGLDVCRFLNSHGTSSTNPTKNPGLDAGSYGSVLSGLTLVGCQKQSCWLPWVWFPALTMWPSDP